MGKSISKKERIVWILIIIGLLAVLIAIFARQKQSFYKLEEQVKQSEDEKKDLLKKEDDLNKQIGELKAEIDKHLETINNFPDNDEDILKSLKRQGFNGNMDDIIDDLIKQSGIIPHKGVLGGKMGFYFKDKIHVLSDRRVFAYFEDGHVSGYAFLAYEIKDNNITWKLMDSYVDD